MEKRRQLKLTTLRKYTLVWDVPTRLFHWLLVIGVTTTWLTSNMSRHLDIHVFAGYSILGLIIFRIIWGLCGGRYARFTAFSYTFRTLKEYIQDLLARRPRRFISHNPLGTIAVYLLLMTIGLSGITGIMTLGGEEQHGPLANIFTFEQGDIFHAWHRWLAYALLSLIAIHVIGVFSESLLTRENLLTPMIHGKKRNYPFAMPSANNGLMGAVLMIAVLTGGATSFWRFFTQTEEHPYLPFVGPSLPQNAAWQDECGDCHLAYHPSLLPARSWKELIVQQENHFDEDLALDTVTQRELLHYATSHAAETAVTEAAWQINRSIPERKTPLRISETRYWRHSHESLTDAVWKIPDVASKANCDACHRDATRGTFEDSGMRAPKAPTNQQLSKKLVDVNPPQPQELGNIRSLINHKIQSHSNPLFN